MGLASALILAKSVARRALSLSEAFRDAAIPFLLTLASHQGVDIWQAPAAWSDLLHVSPLCATFLALAHIILLAVCLGKTGRHPSLLAQAGLLAAPLIFNWLLILQAPAMVQQMGAALPGAGLLTWRGQELAGRVLILAGFNCATAILLNALCVRTVPRELKSYLLLLSSAFLAGLSPLLADMGSSQDVAALPLGLGVLAAILCVAVAQAGLWAETFVMTGLLMDAMKGRRPAGYWGARSFKDGLVKGSTYSALFLGLMFTVETMVASPLLLAVHQVQPLLGHVLLAAGFMPLAKTILESFDGSKPFHFRLMNSYLQPHLYLRGAILGLGMYIIPVTVFIHKAPLDRFLLGVLMGAVAYAGANVAMDCLDMLRGRRSHFQSWRVSLTGALLGGFVGGAISWYVDPTQSAVVVEKFRLYVTLRLGNPHDYIIYPLFSKWGAMNLGPHTGSARILYNESVSGVINWSLAAPLFSVNFFFLTALFARSLDPVRMLFSRQGLVGVAEQTVRVLRWGLWMAPVIYSLLRISGDPTWYNQDGAVRTVAAIWQNITLSPEAFRGWSIQTFMYLLAYDWVRVLIWFDHMGLRVATLVNLSFVGGDALDELLARFQGHPGRARCIPEALRRFATWAPLLIPFFLPQGADWAHVWDTSEAIQKTGQGQVSALAVLLLLFCAAIAVAALWPRPSARKPRGEARVACVACGLRPPGFCPPDEIVLHNGVYTVVQGRDGRGYSRVFSAVRHGAEYDLTNRATSRAHNAGKFLYLREGDETWTLGCRPIRRDDAQTHVQSTGPLSVRMTCTCQGIGATAEIDLPENLTAEVCRLRLTNHTDRARSLELSTYREVCLNDRNPHLRHPFYNRQHIATWFVAEVGAVFARNRIVKTAEPDPRRRRPSPEVYFHAASVPPGFEAQARIVGYQDSRNRFIGDDSLRDPAGLSAPARSLDDLDLHYTFDPIASLRLAVDLEPGQVVDLVLVDGYAPSAEEGTALLQDLLALPEAPVVVHPTTPRGPIREIAEPSLADMLHPAPTDEFRFSEDGRELHVGWRTPRRWAHLMANELGYGTLVTNDGAMSSFMGNSQQNALTPFSPDPLTTQNPGQIFYLRNAATGELTSPTFVPFRERDAGYDITFGPGYCVFGKKQRCIETELTAFVLHDQPVEARVLRIANTGDRPVTYTVTYFAQMILAEVASDSLGLIQAEADQTLGALFFCRQDNSFHRGCAFVFSSLALTVTETSLSRFLGEGRDFEDPYMVDCGCPDTGMDDDGYRAAALSGTITIPARSEACMHVLLGQEADVPACRERIASLSRIGDVLLALERTKTWWRDVLDVMQVETTSPALDRLVNCWLPYQTLTARLWGRLGPQQRGGAYGFRDQLQDVLPLILLRPEQAREQILLHARQQFRDGDVLQWWHQTWDGKTGLGMRNRASDPHLWLPYLTCRYVTCSGDSAILDEEVPFLEGLRIPRDEEGIAFTPRVSRDSASLYEHCRRAMDLTLSRLGASGLPLMGTHDWNDGLNAVGPGGKGTSVWLGFFLYDVLRTMIPLVEAREGQDRSDQYRDHAARLQGALQRAWRGDHFLRAVTDRGEILDYVDALCSAWPLLSGAVEQAQGAAALMTGLGALEKENMVLLLTPFFDESSSPYPGRIADYPPGVRENGAQYSHGASWMVDALTLLATSASRAGDAAQAELWRRHALRVWLKISPLAHALAGEVQIYGLPPHQQPADIFSGPGYAGRGGWSWYTGAAARMLWAAYGLLGIGMEGGRPCLNQSLLRANGHLRVRSVRLRGEVIFSCEEEESG